MGRWILTSHYLSHTAGWMVPRVPGNIINCECITRQELWACRGSRKVGESCPGIEPLHENPASGLVSRGMVPGKQLGPWRGDQCVR